MKNTKQLNQLGLGLIIATYFLLLAAKYFLLLPSNIHLIPLFVFIVVAIVFVLGWIIVPSGEKKLFLPMGIGTGWSLNPRNVLGCLLYLIALILLGIGIF